MDHNEDRKAQDAKSYALSQVTPGTSFANHLFGPLIDGDRRLHSRRLRSQRALLRSQGGACRGHFEDERRQVGARGLSRISSFSLGIGIAGVLIACRRRSAHGSALGTLPRLLLAQSQLLTQHQDQKERARGEAGSEMIKGNLLRVGEREFSSFETQSSFFPSAIALIGEVVLFRDGGKEILLPSSHPFVGQLSNRPGGHSGHCQGRGNLYPLHYAAVGNGQAEGAPSIPLVTYGWISK